MSTGLSRSFALTLSARPNSESRVEIRFPYSAPVVEILKGQALWDPQKKVWHAPLVLWPRLRKRLSRLSYLRLDDKEVQEAFPLLWHKAMEEMKWADLLLFPEQSTDLRKIVEALQRFLMGVGPRGFLLATGTGTGKTYVYSAFARIVGALGVPSLIVVPNEDIARQVENVLRSFAFGGRGDYPIEVTTYGLLESREARGKLLILDESHLAKKPFGASGSGRGKRSWYAVAQCLFTLFVSATPFDRPWESRYLLEPTGFLEHLDTDFDSLMKQYGVGARRGFRGSKEYYFWGTPHHLEKFHHLLRDQGFMVKRLFLPPEGFLEYQVSFIDIPKEEKAFLAEVRRRLHQASLDVDREEKGLVRAQRTILSRAILERIKLKASFSLVDELLSEGWHVILFVQYRSEKVVDFSNEAQIEAFIQQEEGKGKGDWARFLAHSLAGLKIVLPSSIDQVRERYGYLGEGETLGFYTGAQTSSELRKIKESWDEGKIRLLLVTGAKGGVGLSFHDVSGKRPTAQVVLTLPWTASALDQILGRVVRVGVKSPVKILFPVAPVPVERKIASVIANSLQVLGYAVRGGETVVPEGVVKAFLYDLANVNPEEFRKLMAEEGEGKAPFLF